MEADGFIVNDYEPYVKNKIMNRTQMTVTWHLNDLKMSQKDKSAINDPTTLFQLRWAHMIRRRINSGIATISSMPIAIEPSSNIDNKNIKALSAVAIFSVNCQLLY